MGIMDKCKTQYLLLHNNLNYEKKYIGKTVFKLFLKRIDVSKC